MDGQKRSRLVNSFAVFPYLTHIYQHLDDLTFGSARLADDHVQLVVVLLCDSNVESPPHNVVMQLTHYCGVGIIFVTHWEQECYTLWYKSTA